MIVRLRMWAIVMLVAVDQLALVTLSGPAYVAGRGLRPDPDETISGAVARWSLGGSRAARVAERLIDGLFQALGAGRGHCRAAAAREAKRRGNG